MNNPRRVLTRDTIMNKVWGYDFTGDDNIVEVYVGHLRKKLGEPFPIQTIREVGYCLKPAA
jgi:two-component system, OmpR family, response regulator MprA